MAIYCGINRHGGDFVPALRCPRSVDSAASLVYHVQQEADWERGQCVTVSCLMPSVHKQLNPDFLRRCAISCNPCSSFISSQVEKKKEKEKKSITENQASAIRKPKRSGKCVCVCEVGRGGGVGFHADEGGREGGREGRQMERVSYIKVIH